MSFPNVPFFKYTANGNNFVVVDESRATVLSEAQLVEFAYHATNSSFGIGCDNLLVVQECTHEVFQSINAFRSYWKQVPRTQEAAYLFRMFEPDGEEGLCCGNGLMCIADFMWQRYGISNTRIVTEVPTEIPQVCSIGTHRHGDTSWANLGAPRRIPEFLMGADHRLAVTTEMDFLDRLEIQFRQYDLHPYTDATSLTLSGYLVFTGEPHLVILPRSGFSIPQLDAAIFATANWESGSAGAARKRFNFGSWLVHRIGSYINQQYRGTFPHGMNINFARVRNDGTGVEYRCFERGINRETLACGTGALAVAHVVRSLELWREKTVSVLPHRCRWHEPSARIEVFESSRGWEIRSTPRMLVDGVYISGTEQRHRPVCLENVDGYLPEMGLPDWGRGSAVS